MDALKGTLGIGHTRWATHGKPSTENSHPHMDNSNSFAVVFIFKAGGNENFPFALAGCSGMGIRNFSDAKTVIQNIVPTT